MHLMLKSPSGKIPVRRDAAQPSGMESVVSLIGGYASGTVVKSLEHNKSDAPSAAARCQPYSTYDKNSKYKVSFRLDPDNFSYFLIWFEFYDNDPNFTCFGTPTLLIKG